MARGVDRVAAPGHAGERFDCKEHAMDIPRGIYRHYRGNLYEVLGLGLHSETHEPMVAYRALYGEYQLWTRPAGMFLETVIHEGESRPRFAPVKLF
jgi:hypothetical protein